MTGTITREAPFMMNTRTGTAAGDPEPDPRKDAGTGGGPRPGSGLASDPPGDLTAAGDQLKDRRTGYAVRKKRQTGRELNENRKKIAVLALIFVAAAIIYFVWPGPEGRE